MPVATSAQLAREYQRVQVSAARPTQLVVMIYDGAIRFLSLARDRMSGADIEVRNEYILKAQRIVTGLRLSLDLERGGDVAANLNRLYHYMYQQLVEANMYDRPEELDEVIDMLADLRESWEHVDALQGGHTVTEAHARVA